MSSPTAPTRHTLIDVPGAGPSLHIDAGPVHHTYPIAYFRRLADGESVQMLPIDVLRVIVREWLESQGIAP